LSFLTVGPVKGLEQVKSDLDKIKSIARNAVGDSLYLWYEGVMDIAVGITPWDTHALQDSFFVNLAEWSGDTCTVMAGFNIEYAIYVHEDLQAYHPNGGQAKFLEDPYQANLPDLPKFMAMKIDQAFAAAGLKQGGSA
jgi:hypothetical protein